MTRIDHANWKDGSGWQYIETIDNIEGTLTEAELKEGYGDYCENDGDEIREYDDDNNLIASWRRLDAE